MSPYIYEAVIKICESMSEEQAKEAVQLFQNVFVDRFSKLVVDQSNQTTQGLQQAEDFSGTMAKKLTNIEKELFDLHKKQKVKFLQWKNREGPTIEVNPEFIIQIEGGAGGEQ